VKKNSPKEFDAVKFMRKVRDGISKDIADMTPADIKAYFSKKNLNERILPSSSSE